MGVALCGAEQVGQAGRPAATQVYAADVVAAGTQMLLLRVRRSGPDVPVISPATGREQ